MRQPSIKAHSYSLRLHSVVNGFLQDDNPVLSDDESPQTSNVTDTLPEPYTYMESMKRLV